MENIDDSLLRCATLFFDFDADESHAALLGLANVLRCWRNEIGQEIEKTRNGDSIDPDLGHESVYIDAACNHAFVGACAPFIEGTLAHGFAHLQHNFDLPEAPNQHPRWKCEKGHFWKFQKIQRFGDRPRGSVVDGSYDLIAALGIESTFPLHLKNDLAALFVYRNCCFHNGFEWPVTKRKEFVRRCHESGWSDNFTWARTDREPWIAYLSPAFMERCIENCKSLIDAFEAVRIDWTKAGWLRTSPLAKPEWLQQMSET